MLEKIGACNIGEGFIGLEKSMRGRSPRMHDTFRDALMIEVEDLLAEHEIFKERGTAGAGAQGVLIV